MLSSLIPLHAEALIYADKLSFCPAALDASRYQHSTASEARVWSRANRLPVYGEVCWLGSWGYRLAHDSRLHRSQIGLQHHPSYDCDGWLDRCWSTVLCWSRNFECHHRCRDRREPACRQRHLSRVHTRNTSEHPGHAVCILVSRTSRVCAGRMVGLLCLRHYSADDSELTTFQAIYRQLLLPPGGYHGGVYIS